MSWTRAQEEAITARGGNLLLAAAAGSGKTAVLVERIIRRVLDPKDPATITDILVMTFTRAAAQEMRLRIGTALAAAQAAQPSPYLERQLALLGSAQISTIHSFCQTVIRQYFYRLDLDAGYRQGSDSELALARAEVLDETLAAAYASGDERFFALAESMRRKQSDDLLREAVLSLYDYSRSLPFPQAWLAQLPQAYTDDGARLAAVTAPLWRSWQESLEVASRRLARAAQLCAEETLAPWRDVLTADLERIAELAAAPDWTAAYQAAGTLQFVRWPGKRLTGAAAETKNKAKDIRDAVKTVVEKAVAELFRGDPARWGEELVATRPRMEALTALTTAFAERFAAVKRKERIIDFSDLEHLCLSLLLAPDSTPERPQPSEIAAEIAAQYAEVMVDEYQDTNAVQELIASLVSRADNRFMVGDVKQSIYRFRLADPGIFLEKYGTYRDADDAPCRRILLNRNFRSDARILTAVNDVFRTVMRRPLAELDYGDDEALYAGRTIEDVPLSWAGGPVAVRTVTNPATESATSEEAAQAQAQAIAAEIADLRRRGATVARKDGTQKPLEWRDIVILLRSVQARAPIYVDALRATGIPVFAEQAGGYFAATEVALMVSLLTVIDNSQYLTEVMAVLRSPLGGWSEDELAGLAVARRQSPTLSLREVLDTAEIPELREATIRRTRELLAHFDAWRAAARTEGVAPLIRRIYEDTGYLFYVGGLAEGDVRRANLEALYRRAAEFDEGTGGGLPRFIRYLDRLQRDAQDLSTPSVIGEGEDAVRIMTIHKSKGLEFPVVFVAELQRDFNRKDLQGVLLLHRDLGAGIAYFDESLRLTYPTVIYRSIKARLAQENLAEEQRLLYVAMTRARDRLYLYRYADDPDAAVEPTLPAQATCYWDWLAAALARQGGNPDIWDVRTVPVGATEEMIPDAPDARRDAVREGRPTGTALAAAAVTRLEWTYAAPEATTLPAKMTVTELQRRITGGIDTPPLIYPLRGADERTAATGDDAAAVRLVATAPSAAEETDGETAVLPQEWRIPNFIDAPVATTGGTDYGTLVHRVLEQIGRERVTADTLPERLDAWEAQGILTADERARLSLRDLETWLRSPLYTRLSAAEWARFECPFGLLVPACELLGQTTATERIFLQGVMDCVFREDGELVIVDYKTDRVTAVQELQTRYRAQLDLYRTAAERIWGRRVKACVLYSYRLGETAAW